MTTDDFWPDMHEEETRKRAKRIADLTGADIEKLVEAMRGDYEILLTVSNGEHGETVYSIDEEYL